MGPGPGARLSSGRGGSEDAESFRVSPLPLLPSCLGTSGHISHGAARGGRGPGGRGSCRCGLVQARLAGLRRDLGLELGGVWLVSCRDRASAGTGRGGPGRHGGKSHRSVWGSGGVRPGRTPGRGLGTVAEARKPGSLVQVEDPKAVREAVLWGRQDGITLGSW